MSDLWRSALEDLRQKFRQADRSDKLHHVLVEGRCKNHLIPFGDHATQPADPLCDDKLGAPPVECDWSDLVEDEYVTTDPFHRHLFFGSRSAFLKFQELATKGAKILHRLESGLKMRLPEFTTEDFGIFDPFDSDQNGPTPWQYWMLGVHRLAWRKEPNSPLAAERFVWGDHVVLPFDDQYIAEYFGLHLKNRRARTNDELRGVCMPAARTQGLVEALERFGEGANSYHPRKGTVKQQADRLLKQAEELERQARLGREKNRADATFKRLGERITLPPNFFFAELPDDVFQCSVWAIDLILENCKKVVVESVSLEGKASNVEPDATPEPKDADQDAAGPSPGYLGIILNEGLFEVGRAGKSAVVKLGNGKPWKILKLLVKTGAAYCHPDKIANLWEDRPSPETISTHVCKLIKYVLNLELKITNMPNSGWTLEDNAGRNDCHGV